MLKVLIGLIFLSFSCSAHADIQKATTLFPIANEIENSPNGTVVLLDIGGTLLAYYDAVLHTAHEDWKRDWFQTHCPNLSKEEKINLIRIVEGNVNNWKLLDAKWPWLIQKAQTHGAKVVAFTKVVMDHSLKGTRATKLHALGLPIKNDLSELSSGQLYEYAEGVIETEALLKGPVLKEVFSRLAAKPEMIIFVDDRLEQINSVFETCEELDIPCTAFQYVAFSQPPQLDEKIAHYQLSTLLNEKRWVFENEAFIELEKTYPTCR